MTSLELNEAWLESGFLTHNPPVGLGSDFITRDPLLFCHLALLPTIPLWSGVWLHCP